MDLGGLDPKRIPRHVACVMDGNGRWAAKRGLPRTEGHRAGEEALLDAVKGALELGIEWFTVYAFSTENWRRPQTRSASSSASSPTTCSPVGATSCTTWGCGYVSPAGGTGGCRSRYPAHGRDDGADQAQHEYDPDRGLSTTEGGPK